MAATEQPLIGADAVYRTGLETLVSQSPTIVAGPISHYSKRVVKESEPGPNAIPLKWTVTGSVDHPRTLKGSAVEKPVVFSRAEQSMIIPRDPSRPEWELQYGDLLPAGEAVLFLQGDPAAPSVRVLPGGTEQPGLAVLVAEIVKIQALGKGQQQAAWLALVAGGAGTDKVQIAMRSLLASRIEWEKLSPSLTQLMRNHSAPDAAPAFAYGAVTFWLTQGNWRGKTGAVASFLCQTFAAERNDDLAVQFVLNLKQVMRYADVEEFRKERQPLRDQVLHCLRNTPAQGPEVEEQYKDIFSQHAQ